MDERRRARARELVDEHDIDALVLEFSQDEISSAYMRNHERRRAGGPVEDEDWWAVDAWMSSEWWASRERVRIGILSLIDSAPDDHALGYVGAGPLEDFISDDEQDLQWIEEQARQSEAFRIALRSVWVDTYVTRATMARLDAAAGEPLARVRADYVPSAEQQASEAAKKALLDAVGDEWPAVLLNPRTPEELILVERFAEAERAFLRSIDEDRHG